MANDNVGRLAGILRALETELAAYSLEGATRVDLADVTRDARFLLERSRGDSIPIHAPVALREKLSRTLATLQAANDPLAITLDRLSWVLADLGF